MAKLIVFQSKQVSKAFHCFGYSSVKQRAVCIMNVWGYTEILPFSPPKFDWHVNIGFSTHRGFSLLSACYPEQGCRERSTKFELYLAARPHLGDISNSNLAGRRKSRKWGLAAEYRSKWRRRCRIWGYIGDEFHKENQYFRG